jgi:hypothetical protein
MTPQFDVFRNDRSDEVTWLTAVSSVAEGQTYVEKLSANSPGSYFIFSQKNGTRHVIDAILSPNIHVAPRLPAQSGLAAITHPRDYSLVRRQASARFFGK